MKVYAALYCSCTEESAYETLSLHMTKEGAEKAVEEHKAKVKEFNERFMEVWDAFQDWDVQEMEVQEP